MNNTFHAKLDNTNSTERTNTNERAITNELNETRDSGKNMSLR